MCRPVGATAPYGRRGNGLPHQPAGWFAMTAKVKIYYINRRCFSTNRVIASQCSHWRGNPYSCNAKHCSREARHFNIPTNYNCDYRL